VRGGGARARACVCVHMCGQGVVEWSVGGRAGAGVVLVAVGGRRGGCGWPVGWAGERGGVRGGMG
jgi:hypothetical protein